VSRESFPRNTAEIRGFGILIEANARKAAVVESTWSPKRLLLVMGPIRKRSASIGGTRSGNVNTDRPRMALDGAALFWPQRCGGGGERRGSDARAGWEEPPWHATARTKHSLTRLALACRPIGGTFGRLRGGCGGNAIRRSGCGTTVTAGVESVQSESAARTEPPRAALAE
jgi:hypothetical protein